MIISAACHIHSEWSYDGKWTLPILVSEFSHRRYRVLMVTEHDRGFNESKYIEYKEKCEQASSNNMLVLPGIEYSDINNIIHVLVWGLVPFLGESVPTIELLQTVKEYNGVAVFAHPSRLQAWRLFDPCWCGYLDGIEVWNRKADGWAPSREAIRLIQETNILPFVGLDFHDKKQMFPLSMDLETSDPVTEETILDCFKKRKFTAKFLNIEVVKILNGWRYNSLVFGERLRRTVASNTRLMRR